MTKEDFDSENSASGQQVKDEEPVGLILPSGEINWDCPCLQGMGDGPCGQEFKDAFSCFHYSEAEPKGSDCLTQFKEMQECFVKHPEIYGSLDDEDDDENEAAKRDNEAIMSSLDVVDEKKADEEEAKLESKEQDV